MIEKLALGTVQFGVDYGINNDTGKVSDTDSVLHFAKEKGINTLDTAQAYGNSEEVIGKFIQQNGNAFNIISKLSPKNINSVSSSFKNTLKELHSQSLYGFMYHNFDTFKQKPESIELLKTFKEEGKIKKIGFSLYFPYEAEYLLDNNIECDIVQLPYNIFDRRFDAVFNRLKQKGVEIHIRSSFLQGLFFMKKDKLPDNFQKVAPKLDTLQKISESTQTSIAELCLQYIAKNSNIDKIVVGVDKLADLKENYSALSVPRIEQSTIDQLDKLQEDDENIILPINWKK